MVKGLYNIKEVIKADLDYFISFPYVLKVDVVLPTDATVDQTQTAIEAIKAAQGDLSAIAAQVITLIGLVVGVIGRIQAEKKIA